MEHISYFQCKKRPQVLKCKMFSIQCSAINDIHVPHQLQIAACKRQLGTKIELLSVERSLIATHFSDMLESRNTSLLGLMHV